MHARILAIGLLAVGFASTAFAQDAAGSDAPRKHVNLIVGQKMMSDKDWDNLKMKNQTSFGLETSWGIGKLPVFAAVDLLYSQATAKAFGVTYTGHTLEVGLGARGIFDLGFPVAPYVGGGLAYGTGTITCKGCSSDDASGTGLWVDGGAMYRLSKLNVGAGFRYSAIEGKTDDDFKIGIGGINVNLLVGFGF